MTARAQKLEDTGERFLPWAENAEAQYEHFHRYLFSRQFARGKKVIDLACGEGYGAAMLAEAARSVSAIDIAPEVIRHARERYPKKNLTFIEGSIENIPLEKTEAFDLAVCFEAIEHVNNPALVLQEAKRLLRKDGLLVISTPNKLTFSDEPGTHWPWHTREFYHQEFRDLLKLHFKNVVFFGQKIFSGSRIWPLEITSSQRESIVALEKTESLSQPKQDSPLFFVAIASDASLEAIGKKLRGSHHLIDPGSRLLREKNNLIKKFTADHHRLNEFVQNKEEEIKKLTADHHRLSEFVQNKEEEIRKITGHYRQLNEFVQNKEEEIKKLTHQLHEFLQKKEEEIKKLTADHRQLNEFAQNKEEEIRKLSTEYESLIKERESLQGQLRAATGFIEGLKQSLTWRLAAKYRSLLARLAPRDSKRRRAYDLMLRGVKAIEARGWRAFLAKPLFRNNPSHTITLSPRLGTQRQDIAVCTVASKNYLGYLRTFCQSFLRYHPGVKIYVLLADRIEGAFEPARESFETILAEDLDNVPNPQHLFFKYSVIELNTALKPYFFEYLFKKLPIQKLIFFDPDIIFFDSLDTLWQLLAVNSLVLTPHITAPYTDSSSPGELHINQAGTFNLGFIGMSRTDSTQKFLRWWKDRLYNYCFMSPEKGMHVDQKWIDFAPVMFEDVHILRDPVYNIAYWNLHERGRALKFEDGKLTMGARPAVFFHFSGFELENIEKVSRHQDRFTLKDLPNLRLLFEYYRDLLLANGQKEAWSWPYAYDYFDNCVRIPPPARKAYVELGKSAFQFGNPFTTSSRRNFLAWLNQPVDEGREGTKHPLVTRLIWEVYKSRTDVQRAFPDPLGRDRQNLCTWFRTSGVKEHHLDDVFIPPIPALPPSEKTNDASPVSTETNGHLKKSLRGVLRKGIARVFQKLRHTSRFPLIPLKRSLAFGVNIAGYLKGEFGVAEAARASVRSLQAAEVPYVLNDIQTTWHRHEDKSFEEYSESNPYLFNLVHVNADEIHSVLSQKGGRYFHRRHNIGFWFWEVPQFPAKWLASFSPYREIWTGSSFCQQSIARVSPIPVLHMPLPFFIEENSVGPDRSHFKLPEEAYVFLFQFDYLGVFERKNPLGVLKAFERAFGERKDVLLVFKTINSHHAAANNEKLKRAVRVKNVRFFDGHMNRGDFFRLMASCDCYVSLHRSEGIGMGMGYSMLLGKPVIATAYSGNMDFMDSENSFLVRYQLAELERDYGSYQKGNVWAEPDLDHAAELLKLVYEDRELAARKALRAQEDIRRQMNPAACGARMAARFRLLAGSLTSPHKVPRDGRFSHPAP